MFITRLLFYVLNVVVFCTLLLLSLLLLQGPRLLGSERGDQVRVDGHKLQTVASSA